MSHDQTLSPALAQSWTTTHAATSADLTAMAGLRALVEPQKGMMRGIAARPVFDAIMSRTSAPDGVTFEPGTVGGISGWWCHPTDALAGRTILHLHGGWYNWGTALAFRHLVGHIAKQAGAEAFIPDYRLAPEHVFPAATLDVRACYDGLIDIGRRQIALVGDSAGGGLALSLLSSATRQGLKPVGAIALSPVTDLAMRGASWETRATADPYFVRSQAEELVKSYLAGHNPADPIASPLYGDLAGLPPIRVHVGDDEMLLDDSRRYVERAVASGVDASLTIWDGMPHGFLSGVGRFLAADMALGAIGAFLMERFTAGNVD